MILIQKCCPLMSISKTVVTIQLQIEMNMKEEGSLMRKRKLSSCVNNETIHSERKLIAKESWLDQLSEYKIETWILDLSYRFGCTFYNKQLLDKMLLIVA